MSDNIDSIDESNFDDDMPKGEKADKNTKVRQRIDDLLEKKRLKELLDDSEDWEL